MLAVQFVVNTYEVIFPVIMLVYPRFGTGKGGTADSLGLLGKEFGTVWIFYVSFW